MILALPGEGVMFPGIIIVAWLTFLIEDSITRIPLYSWRMHVVGESERERRERRENKLQ